MKDTALAIVSAVNTVIERTPPDIVADVMSDRIYVTGGGSLVTGMGELLREKLNTEIQLRTDAEYSVVKGAQAALRNPALMKNIDYQLKNLQDLVVET